MNNQSQPAKAPAKALKLPSPTPKVACVPWFWNFINSTSKIVCAIRLKRKFIVDGPVPTGPVLICAKHSSAFDIVLLTDITMRTLKQRPWFQMGSFVGYRLLGPLSYFMRRLGGFPVMRPKEVRRLTAMGHERRPALQYMKKMNEGAELNRQRILKNAGTLVVFPEGTRDSARLLPLVSELEVRTAAQLQSEGLETVVWPTMIKLGPPRFFRRPALIQFLEPFPVGDLQPEEVLAAVGEQLQAAWDSSPEQYRQGH